MNKKEVEIVFSDDEEKGGKEKVQKYFNRYLNLEYYPNFLSPTESLKLFETLEKEVPFNFRITKNGKPYNQRVSVSFGEENISYAFGSKKKEGKDKKCLDWNSFPIIIKYKEVISSLIEQKFNYCVVQRYPPGKGIKKHRDREIATGTVIAGL